MLLVRSAEPRGAKFCDGCGTSLIESVQPATSTSTLAVRLRTAIATPDELEGERKNVTALFAGIKGSLELMEDLHP
jgi:hypothetical protein